MESVNEAIPVCVETRRGVRRRRLMALMVLFFFLACVVSVVLPPRQGPQETTHYNYVWSVATGLHLLTPSALRTLGKAEPFKSRQPPLYYAAAAVPFAMAAAIFDQRGAPLRAVRLFDAILGLLWVYFSYRLARELFPKDDVACLVCTAIASLLPTRVYLSGVVNNKVAVGIFYAGSLWMMVRFVRSGLPRLRSAVCLGLCVGLAGLAGNQGLVLLPLLPVSAFLAARRQPKGRRLIAWKSGSVALLMALVVCGWWYLRTRAAEGQWVATLEAEGAIAGGWRYLLSHPSEGLSLLYRLSNTLFVNFWTPFDDAFAAIIQSRLYIAVMSAFTAVGLCGMMIFLFLTRGDRLAEEPMDRGDILLLLFVAFLLLLAAVCWQAAFLDESTVFQGYLLLPVAGPISAVLVAGYRGLSENRDAQIALMLFPIAVVLALNAFSIYAIASRYAG